MFDDTKAHVDILGRTEINVLRLSMTPYLGERDFLEAFVARITARGVAEEGVFLGGLLLNPEGESRSDPPFGARTLGDPVQAGLWTLKKPPSKILSLGSPFSSTLVERTERNKDI